ncbi:MAG: hypothetical protein UY47_C0004G0018 [Parcubacteria group bacterium GW2011_GWB1_49_7]|nr:MAG: hypothetical protein UX71_C0002G0094 [Parcubacteria group bacterium GW2011_GWA1_47_10]KKW09844.1 MAG: hypothetical protein UY47_C0004G0018 [Parcubacteria group bacterium GW2011_GWB1_49_7]
MAQQHNSRAAKALQFLGIAANIGILTAVGLAPVAALVGLIAIPAGVAACFD